MKTSILICATCLVVTGCSAQLRFPSLSSALSSLTGFGGSSSSAGSGSSSASSAQSSQASPYSGLVRDYGRNLMMAMSNIYPTLFKPPQQPQQQAPSQPSQSPFDQAFSASQYGSPSLYSSGSAPSFSFGGSTFSISPSLPFGSLGSSQQHNLQPAASHSPFSASFGSSINSPSSFGPLSSSPFLPQSMPSFAPSSSYNSAFETANNAPSGPPSFGGINSAQGIHAAGSQSLSNQQLLSQPSNSNPINSYPSISNFNSQHDSVVPMGSQHHPSQQQASQIHQQSSGLGSHSVPSFGNQPHNQQANQFPSQNYRPDMMSLAASASANSNSYSNYANIPSASPSHQAPASQASYQQPSSYR